MSTHLDPVRLRVGSDVVDQERRTQEEGELKEVFGVEDENHASRAYAK